MMNSPSKHLYFSQLNGIRFLAVMLVLVDHWFSDGLPIPIGHLGVVIFFVLSGFLITRILFLNADEVRNKQVAIWTKVKNFIVRRSLRIFPIYFLICFIGIFFNISPIREQWPWLLFYLPNWFVMVHQQWLGVWDHFWSLALEEQYYLVFPYFILLLNPTKYKSLFITMFLIGFFTRTWFYFQYDASFREEFWFTNYVNPFAAIDCFGLGGLLAFLFHYQKLPKWKYQNSAFLFASLAVPGILWYNQTFQLKHQSFSFLVLERLVFAVFAFFLIWRAIQEKNDLWGKFLINKQVDYLGKISYGIYLYHNFIYNVYHGEGNTLFGYVDSHFQVKKFLLFQNQISLFLCNFIVLVFVASISWFFVEKPLNSLKNKFE